MRSSIFTAIVGSLVLQGCTSSTSDVLDVGASNSVTTGSVEPRPVGQVGKTPQAFPYQDNSNSSLASDASQQIISKPSKPAAVKTAMKRVANVKKSSRVKNRMKVYSSKFRDHKPINFGRTKPQHYPIHGVDVSRWQGHIDWRTLRKQGANFAYIKATDGGDHLDKAFKRNWKDAKAAGVPRGAYHFMYWCRVASEQADWFIRNVPKEKGALPPVIDVEWNNESKSCRTRPSRSLVLKKMKVFMKRLERHYGQKPIIYTAPDFYEDNLKGQFKEYSFWLRAVAEHPSKVYPGRDFAFWQYSGTGLSKGLNEPIDLNVFNGKEANWHKWLAKRVY